MKKVRVAYSLSAWICFVMVIVQTFALDTKDWELLKKYAQDQDTLQAHSGLLGDLPFAARDIIYPNFPDNKRALPGGFSAVRGKRGKTPLGFSAMRGKRQPELAAADTDRFSPVAQRFIKKALNKMKRKSLPVGYSIVRG